MYRFRLIFLLLATCAAFAQTAPVPYIAAPLSPSTLPPGSQGFVMTVHGDNFGPTAVLEWNGNQKATVVTSSTLLTATIDTSDLTKPGTAQVTVVNLGKKNRVSNTAFFILRKPAPAVSIAPDPAISAPNSVSSVVADFNHDGIPDVATCTPDHFGSVVTVYLGEGHNKFQAPIKSNLTGSNKVASGPMLVGDFNNDGSLDLVIGSALERSSTVVFGDGKGHFRNPVNTPNSAVPYAVGDIDGDGKLDLLTGAYFRGAKTSSVEVWLGNGDGTFGRGSQLNLGIEGSPILGDFDEDGNLDIAVPRTERQSVMVFLNQGGGVFKDHKTYSVPLTFGIAAADMNGDGHLDIVTDKGGVLIGRGDGTFVKGKDAPNHTETHIRPPALIAPGTDIAVADFNGDGNQDVLEMGNQLTVYLGNGDGTLQPGVYAGGGPTTFGGLGDFDQNGHLGVAGDGGIYWQISAGLDPYSIDFGQQKVGTSSKPKSITLYNAGSTPLTVTSITLGGNDSGDFSQTNNCPSSVPVGGNCQIQVTFTPSKSGNRAAKLTVVYPGVGSPLTTALSGSGILIPKVTLTPSKLIFGKQLVNTTSAPLNATLTNVGDVGVQINNISTIGTFGQTNNCPSELAPGKHCLIHVTFTPTDNGRSTGYLAVDDSAPNSPQTASLAGVGTSVKFSPIGVNFGDQQVGTSSNPQPITFTNEGKVALNISSVSIGGTDAGDFSQTNNCPSSLPPGGNCTIQVTFTPTQKGDRQGYLQLNDDVQPSPQQAGLGGTGT